MHNEFVETIAKTFLEWSATDLLDHDANCTNNRDEIMNRSFLGKLIIKKLEWAGVDVIVPDLCLIIIVLCSETPAEVQMIMTDLLDGTLKRNNFTRFPKNYKITSSDFSYTFSNKFPIVSEYKEIKDMYNKKWDDQKVDGRNMYDTIEFWDKYKSFAEE